jgi:hypothetical protein
MFVINLILMNSRNTNVLVMSDRKREDIVDFEQKTKLEPRYEIRMCLKNLDHILDIDLYVDKSCLGRH